MKKRELIEALAPLDDDTEILIPGEAFGLSGRFSYIDDRFRGPLISKNQVRLYGLSEPKPWQHKPIMPHKVLGVDPLRTEREMTENY